MCLNFGVLGQLVQRHVDRALEDHPNERAQAEIACDPYRYSQYPYRYSHYPYRYSHYHYRYSHYQYRYSHHPYRYSHYAQAAIRNVQCRR